jgi:hypothetical protein
MTMIAGDRVKLPPFELKSCRVRPGALIQVAMMVPPVFGHEKAPVTGM